MWNLFGLCLSILIAAVAWRRPADLYGMSAAVHRRYAFASLAFAAFFVIAYTHRADSLGMAGLALYAVVAVFYGASFLRGAADDER